MDGLVLAENEAAAAAGSIQKCITNATQALGELEASKKVVDERLVAASAEQKRVLECHKQRESSVFAYHEFFSAGSGRYKKLGSARPR